MTIQLRKASFRKWLEAKEPADRLGQRYRPCDCPLAHFLRTLGAPDPEVFNCDWRPDFFADEYHRLPPWAVRFRKAADTSDRAQELTAALCLQLLEQANA